MFTNQEFDQVVASGLPQVILPMLIVFCIVYLILLQSKALGEHKGTNVMVSLVMSLILGVPHILGVYPKDFNPIIIMNNIIGGFALFIFGILIAVIVLTFIVKDPKKFLTGANYGYFIPLIILAYIAHAFPHLLPFTFGIIIILVIMGWIEGTRIFVTFYLTIVLISLMIIDFAFGIPHTLPRFLSFVEDPTFQTVVLSILFLVLIATYIIQGDNNSSNNS
ncbi:hypothetical protein HOK51_01760 [Candidatus Woesearchaeota archaeon]|jgi:hypothetical protein|nr:hypothetical protein [Candidatus Woesearchaeota archaeon]MBT6518541.1 hypothetical protein [Candidatus Woesearchaeota archaeon]MBT7368413.1 hypothetical protein [Candidatus Woesearchaeota archaeon]